MNKQINIEALEDKGFPFQCENCGNKPTPQQVVDHDGDCEFCGDTIITFTIDTAEILLPYNIR